MGVDYRRAPERYHFVRFMLDGASLWIGYSMEAKHFRTITEDPTLPARLVESLAAGGIDVAVTQRRTGWPFTVLRGPEPLTTEALAGLSPRPRTQVNLMLRRPMTYLSEDNADERIESDLLSVVGLCRSVHGLEAP